MNWYYMHGQDRMGPVDEGQFQALLAREEVSADTFVWRQGMGQWQKWGQLEGLDASVGVAAPVEGEPRKMAACVECGQRFDVSEMISYQGSMVCGLCKPIFFQRIREGAALPSSSRMEYADFGRRWLAKIVDGLILLMVNVAVSMMTGENAFAPSSLGSYFAGNGVSIFLFVGYNTFFLGRFAATPGKMLLGIRAVRSDGSPISYPRAMGRTFSEYISSILLIGYLMAAFDKEERRTLHDRICDTRVIMK